MQNPIEKFCLVLKRGFIFVIKEIRVCLKLSCFSNSVPGFLFLSFRFFDKIGSYKFINYVYWPMNDLILPYQHRFSFQFNDLPL